MGAAREVGLNNYARQKDDNRIAVSDALPLDECWKILSDTYEKVELVPSDYVPNQLAMYERVYAGVPDGKDQWVKSCIMQDKAMEALRSAIARGILSVWIVRNGIEVSLTRCTLPTPNIKYGTFKSLDRPEPDIQEAKLWLKKCDWSGFITSPATGIYPQVRPHGRPRELDHEMLIAKARSYRTEEPGISKGSAAASIVVELGNNPKTGKSYDQRGIEKIIAPLWVEGTNS